MFISCEGREDRIGQTGNLRPFAIAENQSTLAVVISWVVQQGTGNPQQGFQVTPGTKAAPMSPA